MKTLGTLAVGLGLLAAGAAAQARMHQICFQIPGASPSQGRAAFGCHVDGGGSCLIDTPVSGSTAARLNRSAHWPGTPMGSAGGRFWVFDLPSTGTGTYTAEVRFFDASGNPVSQPPRQCTVNVTGLHGLPLGHGTPAAELAGFSTDASGLVTTGLWKLTSAEALNAPNQQLEVPADFVVTGGGVIGAQVPAGALIDRAYRASERVWQARTSDMLVPNPHQQTIYAIGLRIEGLPALDLNALIMRSTAGSGPMTVPHPAAQATQAVIGGAVVLGGTVFATGSNSLRNLGQFATVSAPVIGKRLRCTSTAGILDCTTVTSVTGWRVESKDHGNPHPGSVSTEMLELPLTITVGGQLFEVHGRHVQATSAVAAHPAVDVGGLRGEYALTGIGAAVDWRSHGPSGNLLWKLEPRADLGGASVASKDHVFPSPATITGFALGIKLVRPGTVSDGREPLCRIDKASGQLLCF